jgi:hypothetical protein
MAAARSCSDFREFTLFSVERTRGFAIVRLRKREARSFAIAATPLIRHGRPAITDKGLGMGKNGDR